MLILLGNPDFFFAYVLKQQQQFDFNEILFLHNPIII